MRGYAHQHVQGTSLGTLGGCQLSEWATPGVAFSNVRRTMAKDPSSRGVDVEYLLIGLAVVVGAVIAIFIRSSRHTYHPTSGSAIWRSSRRSKLEGREAGQRRGWLG